MVSRQPKVFGIGLSKTGTTSLARALEILGYRTRDFLGVTRYLRGDLSSVDLTQIDAHEAFTDTPIPSFYRELDVAYPGSKFILTVRDREGWLRSCKKQFTRRLAEKESEASRALFQDLYGGMEFDEQRYSEGYDRFVRGVEEHFLGREDDLLVLDVTRGQGWRELCAFLGKPVPEVPFPVTNVTAVQWIKIDALVDIARDAGGKAARVLARDPAVGARIPAAVRAGAGTPGRLDRYLDAFVRGARILRPGRRGGVAEAVTMAARVADEVIRAGLRRLSPSVPVISSAGGEVAYADRKAWTHVWLVDPLGGAGVLSSADLFVSIALVEQGRPLYGVVYVPATDTAYYARGTEGYRRQGSAAAERLSRAPRPGSAAADGGASRAGSDGLKGREARLSGGPDGAHVSPALAMCLVAEGTEVAYAHPGRAAEMATAAAHAVARAAGRSVHAQDSGEELTYNKKVLAHAAFVVECAPGASAAGPQREVEELASGTGGAAPRGPSGGT
jgi:3'-phosphoadenosine 5'-phosphosulfate (PAPS) 3'-phosphatase